MKNLKQIVTTSILGSLIAGSVLYTANTEAITYITTQPGITYTSADFGADDRYWRRPRGLKRVVYVKKVAYVVPTTALTIEQARFLGPANYTAQGAHLISLNNGQTVLSPLGRMPSVTSGTYGSGFKVVSGGVGLSKIGINGIYHAPVVSATGVQYLLPTNRGFFSRPVTTTYGWD